MSSRTSTTFKAGLLALLFTALVSVAAYGRGGGGGHGGGHGGGGFHGGGGGGFHGGGGGFRGGGFHGGGFHGGGFHGGGGRAFHGGGFYGGARAFSVRPHAGPSFARPSFQGSRFHASRSYGPRWVATHRAPRFTAQRQAMRAATPDARAFRATRNANAVRNAFASRPIGRALHNTNALRNPATRAFVTAGVATAAWHGWHHRGPDWWRHRNGGFGWVGPVFWPFAFYDIYDYALWGYGYDDSFWGYGYPDIYAGIFGPYGYDDLTGYAGYLPQYAGRSSRGAYDAYAYAPPNSQANLAQMCGEESRAIAGLPIDVFQRAIQPDDAQRAALDELAGASAKAAQSLKASCPTDVALTAPRRLAIMQQRIEAMIAAVQTVQTPLETFYGLLTDEQKARLNALADEKQRPAGRRARAAVRAAGSSTQTCAAEPAAVTDWPGTAIEQGVKPTDEQRKRLDALQAATVKAADMLKASCPPEAALTPAARLAAMGQRLDTMLQAVKTVRAPMDEFYGSLNDEQKANFDAIGPRRLGASEQPDGPRHVRRSYRY